MNIIYEANMLSLEKFALIGILSTGKVTKGGKSIFLAKNHFTYSSIGETHTLKNLGNCQKYDFQISIGSF